MAHKSFVTEFHQSYHVGLNAQLLAFGKNYRSAGIRNYIYQLLCHLPPVNQDFRYTVWTGERQGMVEGMDWHVTRLPTIRPPVRILWEQLLQPVAVAQAKPDLLHGMAFVLPLWLAKPGVITVYDLTFFHLPGTFRAMNRLYLQTMTRLSARRAAHICAIAEYGKTDIVQFLGVPPSKVTVVYPGLDPSFAHPPSREEIEAFRQRQGLPERYLLYLGTLEPRKNVPALLRAFAKIERRLPKVPLVLAGGKGWGFDEIFAEVERLGLQERVHFPGYVPAEDLKLWYAAAELFVYPSRYEGFGLPPLEAMACGTAVLTSNASSLTEVVGEAGLTVSPDDEEALAAAIWDLMTDADELAVRQEAGLQQAARFQWTESARIQAGVYRRVLEDQLSS